MYIPKAITWWINATNTIKEWFGITSDIISLEHERMAWSLKTFPEATEISSLEKAKDEIEEIRYNICHDIKDPVEYADAIMCLFDSAGRNGIPPEAIVNAYRDKIKINKSRVWKKNANNTYSHVK